MHLACEHAKSGEYDSVSYCAGQSSTITGVYTGQFVMSGFLDMQISQWQRISITRSVALVPTLLVSLLYRQPGGTELDTLNEWLNVLQSMQIPFALLPVRLPALLAHLLKPLLTRRPITCCKPLTLFV